MTMLKAEEDLPIEAKMVTTAVEGSQKKVEAHNFDIRKHVLQYDDVINTQREVIYRERRKILGGEDISEAILDMLNIHTENAIYSYINPDTPPESWRDEAIPSLYKALISEIPQIGNSTSEENLYSKDFEEIKNVLFDAAQNAYNLKASELGAENIKEAERQVMLHVIDNKWIEHLHNMDALREGIHLRGYGQKDPLMEYKREAFDMFEQLLADVKRDTVILLMHAHTETVSEIQEEGVEV